MGLAAAVFVTVFSFRRCCKCRFLRLRVKYCNQIASLICLLCRQQSLVWSRIFCIPSRVMILLDFLVIFAVIDNRIRRGFCGCLCLHKGSMSEVILANSWSTLCALRLVTGAHDVQMYAWLRAIETLLR